MKRSHSEWCGKTVEPPLKDLYLRNPANYGPGTRYGPPATYSTITAYIAWFNDCDLCRCTCDQSNHGVSVRKVYTGILEAPEQQ